MKLIIQGLPPSPQAKQNGNWRGKANVKKLWGEKTNEAIKQITIPPKPYQKALVHYKLCFGDLKRRDPDNFSYAVTKPSLDSLVRAGILVDDSTDNVTLTYEFSREKPKRFEITITEEK